MKAKTIVGLMACAVLVPAFADTTPIDNSKPTTNSWFGASVSGSNIITNGATWNAELSVENSKMVIDADAASPVALTPTNVNSKTVADLASDGLVTITSSAYLAPSATNDLPNATALEPAQVGFAVAVDGDNATNYYGYVRTAENVGTWFKLTGATPPNGENDTAFTIVLDYRSDPRKVSFVVDSTMLADGNSATAFTFVPASAKLSDVAAIGSGTITSINAKYEKAVAVGKDGKAYGTIAQAYNAPGEEGTVVAWDPSTGAAATGAAANAANGASKAVCMALNVSTTDANAALTFVPTAETPTDIVLQTAVAPVDNVTVTFAVKEGDTVKGSGYSASNIAIPKEAGQYTIVPTVSAKSN